MNEQNTQKFSLAAATLAHPPATVAEADASQITGDIYLQNLIVASLTKNFGVYSGNWTEPSIRTAGNDLSPDVSKQLEQALNKAHPPAASNPFMRSSPTRNDRGKDNIYGHWMLPSGALTGQLHDHAQSATQVLGNLPGYKQRVDPIFDLMKLSGVIRIRYAKDKHLVVDIVRKPSVDQLHKLVDLAESVENKGGSFMFSVLTPGDTGTLAEGMSSNDLLSVDWRRLPMQ